MTVRMFKVGVSLALLLSIPVSSFAQTAQGALSAAMRADPLQVEPASGPGPSSGDSGVVDAGSPASDTVVGGDETDRRDPSAAVAGQDPFYCGQRKLGTWFYCDKPKRWEKENPSPAISATSQLSVISKHLDELRAKAILEPTSENVVAYIKFQREQLDRASTFTDVWQRAIWQNPEIDYTLQRPVSTLGKGAWTEQRNADRALTMENLSQRYGIYYFYSSACGACKVFSPILRGLSAQYNLSVLPVSMDGGANEFFDRFVVDHGQYQRMGLTGGTIPALVLFDTVTKKPIPIGYGVMGADEVMNRIFQLVSVKPGSDF